MEEPVLRHGVPTMVFEHMNAEDIAKRLGLAPHPEGGRFCETFRDPRTDASGRPKSTAIYYLLAAGEMSAWHRVDAAEVWHFYAGAPLALSIASPSGPAETARLGPDIAAGEQPQIAVPAGHWQSATPLGDWTLVGCTVAPGFVYDAFELAPAGWQPPAKKITS